MECLMMVMADTLLPFFLTLPLSPAFISLIPQPYMELD
jgi:hypothetical protein